MQDRFGMLKKHHKETFLKAVRDGKADPQKISLGNFFVSTKDFFTSSSCSGRIVLMNLDEKETKREAAFHRKWHRVVDFDEVLEGLNEKTSEDIWFKQEPLILHIGARDLKSAKKILSVMKKVGIRRGGIMVAENGKFIIEFTGSNYMSLPVKSGSKVIISEEHLKFIVDKANKKLERNYRLLGEFEKECRKSL